MTEFPTVRKILLVYDVSYPSVDGGGQRRMYEVAKRLIAQGYQVDWLCFKTWDFDHPNDNSKINFIGLPGYKGLYNSSGSRRYLEPIEFLFSLWTSRIDISQYDVVWSGQWPILHLVPWSYKKGIKEKLVVDWWEVWGKTWFDYSKVLGIFGYGIEKLLIWSITKNSRLIGISESSTNEMLELASAKESVSLIHNGIDTKALKKVLLKTQKNYDFSYIGRLKNHKRVDLLLRSIKYIEDQYSYMASAVIIGDGPEHDSLLTLAKELEIDDRIFFAGSVTDNIQAYSLMSSGKIFVNPSTKEGGGSITVLEAFGLGLPVVAFDCKDGIDPQIVGHGSRGLLVEAVSHEILGQNLYELITSPSQLEMMSLKSLDFAEKFDWDELCIKYKNIFDRI